jgi:hypothetical protein
MAATVTAATIRRDEGSASVGREATVAKAAPASHGLSPERLFRI